MRIACLGGACVDRKYYADGELRFGSSNPGRSHRTFGGVARNVAENLGRLGADACLASVVGDDENGRALRDQLAGVGVDVRMLEVSARFATAEYAAVIDAAGTLVLGVSDMRAIDAMTVAGMQRRWKDIAAVQWLFVDCNVRADVLSWCIEKARSERVQLAIDAVSETKVRNLPDDLTGIALLFLNEGEAAAYLRDNDRALDERSAKRRARLLQERGAGSVVLTRGARGLIAAGSAAYWVPAYEVECIDPTGAGDALAAAILYRITSGDDLCEAARWASVAAGLTAASAQSVRDDLDIALVEAHRGRLGASCVRT